MSAKTKPTETHTEIEFDANFEVHGDRQVVVIVKKVTSTPVTGRGREYSRSTRRTETQVLDAYDARRLVSAITDAFYFEAGNGTADTGFAHAPVVETEPRFFVTERTVDGDPAAPLNGRRFFTYTQAEEYAALLVESAPERTIVVRRTGEDRFDGIVSVWNAEKLGL